ncbi:MAG: hypothetical protein ACRYHQ_16080 [Janthinobacterium lividum]
MTSDRPETTRAGLPLSREDIDLIRQWFNNVQDVNPQYLERQDYDLAQRIYEHLGHRVPNSIKRHTEAVTNA